MPFGLPDATRCHSAALLCLCWKSAGHVPPHECGDHLDAEPACGAQWLGDFGRDSFVPIRLPRMPREARDVLREMWADDPESLEFFDRLSPPDEEAPQ